MMQTTEYPSFASCSYIRACDHILSSWDASLAAITGVVARSIGSRGPLRVMMDILEDVDLDAMAELEEEYQREAELERALQEAEEAYDMRAVDGELRPFFDEAVLAGTRVVGDSPGCPPRSNAVQRMTPLTTLGQDFAAASGASGSAVAAVAAAPPAVSAGAVAAVTGDTPAGAATPPRRDRRHSRSCTPPRVKRPRPAQECDDSQGSVCLPVVENNGDAAVVGSSFQGLSPPPSLGDEPPAKRRRIRGKGGCATTDLEPVHHAAPVEETDLHADDARFPEFVGDIEWPSDRMWKDMSGRVQRNYAWDKMKNAWCKMRSQELRAQEQREAGTHSGGWKSSWKDARTAYAELGTERRRALLLKLLDLTRAPDWVRMTLATRDMASMTHTRRKVQSALYTWVTRAWVLPPAAARGRDVGTAVRVASRIGWVQQKYGRFRQFVQNTVAELERVDWAIAAEICTMTLVEEGIALIHFHLLLRHADSAVWLPGPSTMRFENITPNVTAAPNLGGGRGTSARTWAGYFYCTVPKIGQVFVDANKTAFRDFPVQGQWVMSLLQAGKIDSGVARSLVYRVAHGVTRLLGDLDAVERHREDAAVQTARSNAVAALAGRQLPFVVLPEVELWDAQYLDLQERYSFLIMEGPSRVGKTLFARSKCPRGQQVYEVNCAAGGEPDLRGYRFGRDGLILLDEVEAEAIARQRKLFQAGTALVQLGTSPTNIHVYTVFVHRVRIVCASNNWTESLARLSEDDRDWIGRNSFYVHCNEQLWVDP